MRYLPFFILLIFFRSALAENVVITGQDTSYAGVEITLLKYADQISGSETVLAKTLVAPDGSFTLTFDIPEIEYVFMYLGVYKLHLFAVPGHKYEIILPPRQDKQPGDLLNPYFESTVVHLATVNFEKDELNTQIRMFNDAFLPYYNKHIMALSKNEDFSELDKNIEQMEKPFSRSKNAYFNNYRKYKYALLRHLAYQHRTKYISDTYFRGQPVLVQNTSYMELFNQVYEKYFHYLSRTKEGEKLGAAIRSEKFDSLRSILAKDNALGEGNLPDLVILKNLHDEFYDDNYSRSALLAILDDFIATGSDTDLLELARSIRDKVTRLLVGFAPPDFKLYDRDSNLVDLQDLRGKYVYLNFCSCFSYTCMNEFKMLSTLYEKHNKFLEIVTVIVDNDPDVINSFLERSNYQWKFLHYGNQSSIIRDYDVRAFPTYYLIDPEGKLVLSPAPSPADEFEARFFKLLRSRGDL